MRNLLPGLFIACTAAIAVLPAAASAGNFTPVGGDVQLAQNFGDTNSRNLTKDRDRNKPRQRYICVVPGNGGANVCRAGEGRIGGVCRCPGTTGAGRLQFD